MESEHNMKQCERVQYQVISKSTKKTLMTHLSSKASTLFFTHRFCVSDIFTKPHLVCGVCVTHDKLWCGLLYLTVSKHPLMKERHMASICSVHTLQPVNKPQETHK